MQIEISDWKVTFKHKPCKTVKCVTSISSKTIGGVDFIVFGLNESGTIEGLVACISEVQAYERLS